MFAKVKLGVVIVHFAVWLVLISNTLWLSWESYAERYDAQYVFLRTAGLYALYIAAFYLHYAWLLPKVFRPKRYLVYGLGLLIMLCLLIVGQWGIYNWLSYLYQQSIKPFRWSFVWYFGLNGLTYLFLSALAWFTWNGIVQAQRVQLLEKAKTQAELHALSAKVNPHFLFNTLNNIYALVREKSNAAEGAILSLSFMMRYILERSDLPKVALRDELNMMRKYLQLQSLRLNDGYDITVQFPEALSKEISLPPLLFLPLLENVFKHGDLSEDGFVDIDLRMEGDHIIWTSVNSIDSANSEHGNGLRILRQRLALLYPGTHDLTLTEQQNTFKTRLTIPLC